MASVLCGVVAFWFGNRCIEGEDSPMVRGDCRVGQGLRLERFRRSRLILMRAAADIGVPQPAILKLQGKGRRSTKWLFRRVFRCPVPTEVRTSER